MPVADLSDRWQVTAVQTLNYEVVRARNIFEHPAATAVDILGGPAYVAASRSRLVVIDGAVRNLYPWTQYFGAVGLEPSYVEIRGGESAKGDASVKRVMKAMRDHPVSIDTPVVAIGGGVIHDVCGQATHEYGRGIVPWTFIGTTLIALIDAAYGGKVGVNYLNVKNLRGGINPAERVIIDPTFLRTLPSARISEGLAEVIKVGLMAAPRLFDLVYAQREDIVRRLQNATAADDPAVRELTGRTIGAMLEEQADNLWVQSKVRWPEFGHDASKVWEMASRGELWHGCAVALNMALMIEIAGQRGLLCSTNVERALATIKDVGLRVYDEVMADRAALGAALDGAVLTRGRQAIPVPVDCAGATGDGRGAPPEIGCAYLDNISVGEAASAARQLKHWAA